jgi:hypothetical protein
MELIGRLHRQAVRLAVPALALGAVALGAATAKAAPLDKAACAKLAQDMQNMKALDVDKLMEKGPAWAVAHLSPSDLGLVRQYIDLDEQMKFRCQAPGSLVHLKHLEDEDEDGAAKTSAEAGPEKTQGAGEKGESPKAQPPAKAAKPPQKRDNVQAGSLVGR